MCAWLFTDTEFISLHPSKSKAEAVNYINKFIDDIGIPMNMHFDNATDFLGARTEFMKTINEHSTNWNISEPYSHWQNRAEYGIKRIKLERKRNIQRT